MFLTKSLHQTYTRIYAATIDKSKFREKASRFVVFILPLFFIGRPLNWHGLWVVGLGLLVRAWAAGYLKKDQTLACQGPYLLARHPLYLGSILLSLGFMITLQHWFVWLFLGLTTFLQYFHTIRHEEANLKKTFGKDYQNFCKTAGPLWPKPKSLKLFLKNLFNKEEIGFSLKQYMKNKEYECLLGVVAILLILLLGSR